MAVKIYDQYFPGISVIILKWESYLQLISDQ